LPDYLAEDTSDVDKFLEDVRAQKGETRQEKQEDFQLNLNLGVPKEYLSRCIE
jgi:hypothetical protein